MCRTYVSKVVGRVVARGLGGSRGSRRVAPSTHQVTRPPKLLQGRRSTEERRKSDMQAGTGEREEAANVGGQGGQE